MLRIRNGVGAVWSGDPVGFVADPSQGRRRGRLIDCDKRERLEILGGYRRQKKKVGGLYVMRIDPVSK